MQDDLGRMFAEPGSAETRKNVEVSIATDLVSYDQLATTMQFPSMLGRSFTIREWLKSSSILVFSGPPTKDEPLACLNRAFLSEFVQTLVYQPETDSSVTWIFLDEAPSIGRLPSFVSLLRECRSKGASTFLGIQDICGFQQAIGDRDDCVGDR